MRKKWMVGVLVASIMSMGAGYAAWSQSFTVTNIVKTGELKVAVYEHGTQTKITKVEAVDASGKLVEGFQFDNLKAIGEGTKRTYQTQAGDKIPYLELASQVVNEEEGVNFSVSQAYPGLKMRAQVMFANRGTLPVIIKAEDIHFIGKTETSKALLESGMVTFKMTPPHINQKLDVLELVPDKEEPIIIEMQIANALDTHQKESLEYSMDFVANQGIGVENPSEGAETEINKIDISRIVLPYGTEITEDTVRQGLLQHIHVSADYKLELKELRVDGNTAAVRVRVEHQTQAENRDWKTINVTVEEAANTAEAAANKLGNLSKRQTVTNVNKAKIDQRIYDVARRQIDSKYTVVLSESTYDGGSNWQGSFVVTHKDNPKEKATKNLSIQIIKDYSTRWNRSTNYTLGDLVNHRALFWYGQYECTQANKNKAPWVLWDTDYWAQR